MLSPMFPAPPLFHLVRFVFLFRVKLDEGRSWDVDAPYPKNGASSSRGRIFETTTATAFGGRRLGTLFARLAIVVVVVVVAIIGGGGGGDGIGRPAIVA